MMPVMNSKNAPAFSGERITLSDLLQDARAGRKIAMLTCYDATTARILAGAGYKTLLVGDSAGQCVLGHDSTLSITLETLLTLTAAVRRGAPNVWLVGDLPFLSYQCGVGDAVRNAGRFLAEAGADVVKMEMDGRLLPVLEAMSAGGIPVMAHIGLLPQHLRMTGKLRAVREPQAVEKLVQLARNAVQAGATSLLLEAVSHEGGEAVTQAVGGDVLVIGCGSGPHVHGQVLVLHDVMGLNAGHLPKFAKTFADVATALSAGAKEYRQAVEAGEFPDAEHSYGMKK